MRRGSVSVVLLLLAVCALSGGHCDTPKPTSPAPPPPATPVSTTHPTTTTPAPATTPATTPPAATTTHPPSTPPAATTTPTPVATPAPANTPATTPVPPAAVPTPTASTDAPASTEPSTTASSSATASSSPSKTPDGSTASTAAAAHSSSGMSVIVILLIAVLGVALIAGLGFLVFRSMKQRPDHGDPKPYNYRYDYDQNNSNNNYGGYEDKEPSKQSASEPFDVSTASFNAKATVINHKSSSGSRHFSNANRPGPAYSTQNYSNQAYSTSNLQFETETETETPQSQIVMMVPKSTPSSPPFASQPRSSDILGQHQHEHGPSQPGRDHSQSHSQSLGQSQDFGVSISMDSEIADEYSGNHDDGHGSYGDLHETAEDRGSYGESYAESYGIGGSSYMQSYGQSMLDRDTMGSVGFHDNDDTLDTAPPAKDKASNWMEAMDEMRGTNDSYAMLEANSFGSARGSAMRFSTDSDFSSAH